MILLAAILLLVPAAPDSARDSRPATLDELKSRVDSILRASHTAAAGIALIEGDTVLWVGGLGKADVASGRPADETTLFRIGSTSKAFAAMVILRLVRDGKLSLETPVRDLVPEIVFSNRWEATDPVRVVHLLEHTTGWDDLALKDYGNSDSTPLTLRQGLDFNPAPRVSRWRPGTRYAYNNAGPAVAAYIAEKLEDRPFEELVRAWLFDPIGMRTATYFRTDLVRQRGATLYRRDGSTPFPYWHILMRPAGSINASPLDMAAYLRFLLGRGTVDGQVVMRRAEVERMEHPASGLGAQAGLRLGYGLHLYSKVDSGFVWFGHDGGVSGGLTDLAYLPGYGVGYVVMINGPSGKAFEAIGHLIRRFLTRQLTPPPLPAAAHLDPAVRANYSGWFRPDNPRRQDTYFLERLVGLLRVIPGDTLLILEPLIGSPDTLVAVDSRLLRPTHTAAAVVALTSDKANGKPISIQSGAFGPSLHRVAAPVAWLEVGLAALWLLGMALTLLFALVWVPRWVFRRLRRVTHLSVRAWPLFATLAVALIVGISILTAADPFATLARPTIWSVGLFLLTLAYPLFAVAGLSSAVRVPPAEIRPAIRWLAFTCSLLNVVASGYLFAYGVLGWRPWA
jgi:CubicO group peptidase (beta-lactamase class C family)